jgi:hypothetical protein
MSTSKTGQKVKDGQYGEDLAKEKASATTREFEKKLKSYTYPPGKCVQGSLEAIGGGSADSPSFPLK